MDSPQLTTILSRNDSFSHNCISHTAPLHTFCPLVRQQHSFLPRRPLHFFRNGIRSRLAQPATQCSHKPIPDRITHADVRLSVYNGSPPTSATLSRTSGGRWRGWPRSWRACPRWGTSRRPGPRAPTPPPPVLTGTGRGGPPWATTPPVPRAGTGGGPRWGEGVHEGQRVRLFPRPGTGGAPTPQDREAVRAERQVKKLVIWGSQYGTCEKFSVRKKLVVWSSQYGTCKKFSVRKKTCCLGFPIWNV